MKHTITLTFLKRAIAIAMFAALVAVPATIAYQQSQPAAAKAEFPATPEGKLARALLEVINSGDKAAMESLIKGNLSSRALKEASGAKFVPSLQSLYIRVERVELYAYC